MSKELIKMLIRFFEVEAIITLDYEDNYYKLHGESKQEFYKTIYELREIYLNNKWNGVEDNETK